MNDELKQLIEDAAKLLGINGFWSVNGISYYEGDDSSNRICYFNPCDPERGDLMKVAEAAELEISFQTECVLFYGASNANDLQHPFTKGDYQSLALAILRAASAVWKSRGGV